MAHPASITDEEVFLLLDRLEHAGAKLTPNRVRTEAGGGNPARYRALIERWRVARTLERGPKEARHSIALFDDIAKTIEVELYMRAPFLDRAFRESLSRSLAGRVGGSLIRRGLASEDALGDAPPDLFLSFLEAIADPEPRPASA